MWKQKSRAIWMLQGDRNTRFFHTLATTNRQKNTIITLKDDNVFWLDNLE